KINNRDVFFDELKEYFEEEVLKNYRDLWDFATKNGEFPPNIGLFYEILYSTLEKSMGARKNLREFVQVEEKGRKCSVCGERDVIFFRETANKNKFLRFNPYAIDLTDNQKVLLKYLADGEGLCAVCFIKRTFEIYLEKEVSYVFKDLTFPSTAEVALADFKERALNNENKEFFEFQEKFKEIFQDKYPKVRPLPKLVSLFGDKENLEGAWFFEENLTEKRLKEDLEIEGVSEKEIKELREALTAIMNKVGKPNPYYALLYLDGDNMGKWLSGELLPEIEYAYHSEALEKIKKSEAVIKESDKEIKTTFMEGLKKYTPRKLLTPAIHASISTALRNYALEFVRKIVEEEHLGKLVYAGGDDVLAFVNLKDLFNVMQKLRWAFSGQIKVENREIKIEVSNQTGFVEKDGRFILTMGPEATVSMGVVIAHYKTPLQIVIRKVFEMEKLAKGEGKNRFAICLMKRSGEERIVTAQWKYDDRDTIKTLKEIAKSFDENNEEGYVAKGFIQKFALEFKHLKDEKGNFVGTAEIIKQELSRLLYRSFNLAKGRRISEEERRNFIENLADKMSELFWSIGGNIDYFINFCIIATFINKGGD
ncbi:MAG: type III-B CRISPR-associated protein Cas10/Cmr2, partial [candidate division WOR-3 bacterium]